MTIRVSRQMGYAGRHGIQQADQAIKRDVVRALVELVTNSDDSYRRMESQGTSVDGRINRRGPTAPRELDLEGNRLR